MSRGFFLRVGCKMPAVIVRYLEYIVALSRERHFARAAAACNVTQPTLSAGVKQLEESLNVLIVERRQRFVGFTPEGERVLAWAQRVLADYGGLTQELSELSEGLAGQIHIGAIPVALPALALLTAPFSAIHSRTRYQVISQTSAEIQRGLDEFTVDVGVTYLDNDPLSRVRTVPLFRERYVLLTRSGSSIAGLTTISWAMAATLPLCLLTPAMQNRRIIDAQFLAAGATVDAVIETNSLVTLWSHIRFGSWCTIVPQTFLLLLEHNHFLTSIPLVEPEAFHTLGLVASDREPLAPLSRALLDFAQSMNLSQEIERRIATPTD
jgi:DNA-binding transcriptional LysR family regulator